MSAKNYYKVLQLPHTASPADIRKAYRRLAMMYHPDKNGDEVAASYFREIQEAYHHLSDSHRKSAYDQKKWFSRHQAGTQGQEPLNAISIHAKSKKLNEYLRKLHKGDINKKALAQYLNHLINHRTVNIIAESADDQVKKEIITNVVRAASQVNRAELEKISVTFRGMPGKNETLTAWMEKFIKESRQTLRYEQYKPWIILLITLLLCVFIYYVAS
jgi:curved DNA-binding protein CbpA